MSRTGYSVERAAPHDRFVLMLVRELNHRGYPARVRDVDGDKPDIEFTQPLGETAYIDGKCPDGPNYAIKIGAFHTAIISPILTLFIAQSDMRVHTVVSLQARPVDKLGLGLGPHRATGGGSKTDWYLFKKGGGTPFDDYFPQSVSGINRGRGQAIGQ